MAGSAAEERIRAKVESALRRRRPDARIIHELVLRQGGERIDLAAVWPDGFILAEIKSEKDVMKRLPAQLEAALALGAEIWVCAAEKWRDHLDHAAERLSGFKPPVVSRDGRGTFSEPIPNPDHLPALTSRLVHVRYEDDEGLSPLSPYADLGPKVMHGAALLEMLWADELAEFAVGRSRHPCIQWALEHLSGGEIRKQVCRALLRRRFPRADEPREAPKPPPRLFAKPEPKPQPKLIGWEAGA